MSRIDTLIQRMTLAEKLGQLTMTASSYAVTGPVIAGDSTEAIKAGTIGNLLNMVGAGHVREMQRLAVEESRLGIPLLIGFDVVHGHRTLFPVPLAEASLFDPETWICDLQYGIVMSDAAAAADPEPTPEPPALRWEPCRREPARPWQQRSLPLRSSPGQRTRSGTWPLRLLG